MSDDSEIILLPKPQIEPIWGVTANIVDGHPYGPDGKEIRKGTRKFNAGQKIYLSDVFWGMGGEMSTYIGRYRCKYAYITCSIRTAYVTNFRVELIYSPTIIHRIVYGDAENPEAIRPTPDYIARSSTPLDGSEESRRKAEELAKNMTAIAEWERQHRLEKIKRHETSPKPENEDN